MRIVASIFFLSVLLFNWFGYQLLMDYLQQKQESGFEIKLDNKEYDATTLIEIHVPVPIPYQTDWKEYQRKDGNIIYNGIHYKYVECKLQAGEMIYKCIPNEDRLLIVNARENFFKLVNDLQTKSSQNQSSKNEQHVVKSFNFNYCEKIISWQFNQPELKRTNGSSYNEPALLTVVIQTPGQPPEA